MCIVTYPMLSYHKDFLSRQAWATPHQCIQCWLLSVWYIGPYVMAGAAASAAHSWSYHAPFLPPRAPSLLSCPILSSSSNKYVQLWDHTWVTPTEGEGKDGHWDSGQMSHRLCSRSHHNVLHCFVLLPLRGLPQWWLTRDWRRQEPF